MQTSRKRRMTHIVTITGKSFAADGKNAEMLSIFALGRPDILSFKDLGIRRGIMMLNHLDSLTESEFEAYRKRYSPYGTLASLYLWRIKDGGLSMA